MKPIKVRIEKDKIIEVYEMWVESRWYARRSENGITLHFGKELFYIPFDQRLDRYGGFVKLKHKIFFEFEVTKYHRYKKNIRNLNKNKKVIKDYAYSKL